MSDGDDRSAWTWQPATADEVEVLVADGLSRCTDQERKRFAAARTAPTPHPIARWGQFEQVFSVARVGQWVLFFEDVEEGWEWCQPDADGVLRNYGYDQLELRYALSRWPERIAGDGVE